MSVFGVPEINALKTGFVNAPFKQSRMSCPYDNGLRSVDFTMYIEWWDASHSPPLGALNASTTDASSRQVSGGSWEWISAYNSGNDDSLGIRASTGDNGAITDLVSTDGVSLHSRGTWHFYLELLSNTFAGSFDVGVHAAWWGTYANSFSEIMRFSQSSSSGTASKFITHKCDQIVPVMFWDYTYFSLPSEADLSYCEMRLRGYREGETPNF